MIIGDALFRNNDLDNYLRAQVGAVDEHVRNTVSKTDLGKTDSEIAQQHLPGARVEPLQVDFENPQKDVSEARVSVHDVFDGAVTIDGVRATRSFAFTGDPALFSLKTNPYSSVLPHGLVRGNRIVIGMEGRNDVETLKREIDSQEKTLREYVGRSKAQVDAHNAKLEALLVEAIARRRKSLVDIDALKDRI
ncbi:hypothetical protein X747_28770 [Mesorhizobium sp. LNJC384A00]|uniref:hypothetical protein n=1 Tax=Mesorhizobium sp. LNJC384A00 TaxID=1287268 RepID=UPI0003CECF6A|nr:hypothetical protein [Mesorhizobium sp. LNJC384A00]ESY35299.1 hypothetical protein X747_28770 [Mesorhizobium sp. LNJC384A00]